MSQESSKTIKTLQRKLKLAEQALNQNSSISLKYNDALSLLKKKTQESQRQSQYLQSIINGIEDPLMVIGEDYTISLMNNAISKSIDEKFIADVKRPKCYEVSHRRSSPCEGEKTPCPLKYVFETKKHMRVTHSHSHKDGSAYFAELMATPLFDDEQNCIGVIESSRDITAHMEIEDKLHKQKNALRQQAHYDGLTGLANRTLFNDTLEKKISEANRKHTKLALFFIDLDRFKQINDSLGHSSGDMVLKIVSERINKKLRGEDVLARLGGDEFSILMEDLNKSHDAVQLAQKIIDILEQPIDVEGHTVYVSSSIGISLYPEDAKNAQDLLKNADAAMYKAKDEGRNNFQFYSAEMTELAFERLLMETNLRQALINEEFVVYYQPQVDGRTDKLIGMEALVRWKHPAMGLVSPAKFIPLAEETGLIVQMDRWVMKTAMRQIAKWYEKGFNPGTLALNLSMRQLQKDDFIQVLTKTIENTGFKSEWLELEVTEGQIMNNPDASIMTLNHISQLGIELAIDDFGTGYSSLPYLKKLPINKLKIDQSFVRDLPDSEEDVEITKAVIALTKSLNLRVIAEGVETKEQKEFLVENGCENIQGYYYSKPIPADEMEDRFLKESAV